jgi:mRNA-degrading endonuclease RelE of RelBE toxin-antitoxin system
VSYRYETTEEFWKNFYALPDGQKASVRDKWQIFKLNPFQSSLGTHKIHRLSALAKHTIYSVVIEGNLRILFRIDGDIVTTLDVGTHDLYQ